MIVTKPILRRSVQNTDTGARMAQAKGKVVSAASGRGVARGVQKVRLSYNTCYLDGGTDDHSGLDRAAASEQRRQKRADDRVADKTCFACRETGHTARDCPNAVSVGEGKSSVGICYRYVSISLCAKSPADRIPFTDVDPINTHYQGVGSQKTRRTPCLSPNASCVRSRAIWLARARAT